MARGILSYRWLDTLKAAQLQELAFAVGVASAGRKELVAQGIKDALTGVRGKAVPWLTEHMPQDGRGKRSTERLLQREKAAIITPKTTLGDGIPSHDNGNKQISVLSIDMGIRTLAYAHLTLPTTSPSNLQAPAQAQHPSLSAWRTVTIAPRPGMKSEFIPHSTAAASPEPDNTRESFSPILYASHAYSLLTSLLFPQHALPSSSYPPPSTIYPPLPPLHPQPTHLIIERQRFRTGNSSAVTDWALRVGVFEGMLHAVAETLKRERGLELCVEGVDPKRVAGFWLRGLGKQATGKEKDGVEDGEKNGDGKLRKGEKAGRQATIRAKEVKMLKIQVAKRWLDELETRGTDEEKPLAKGFLESIDPKVKPVVDAYLLKSRSKAEREASKFLSSAQPKPKQKAATGAGPNQQPEKVHIPKLDDLADSLLQGMAYINWQQNRAKAATLAEDGEGDEDSRAGIPELRTVLVDLGVRGVDSNFGMKETRGQEKKRTTAKTRKAS
ncbi:MAG: hypothetical protein Q9160_008821 [Pyrenula sp. 1 TL-2023]